MPGKEQETFESALDDVPWATDGIDAPTYFVENIRGAMVSRGFIKLNMIEHRFDAVEQTVKAVHVVTIVTPIDQTRAWAKYLTEIADNNGVPTEEEILAAKAATEAQEPEASA